MKKLRGGLLVCLLFLGFALAVTTPAHAAKLGTRPNWGACGVSTDSQKLVYQFGTSELRCGTASWGYRHIKDRHYTEFQNLASAGGLNWSDLVHWAIHYNVDDPDHVVVDGTDGCRDRLLYLHDRNGREVWQQRFKVIYNALDGRIITTYPSSSICVR
ncbi:hypothetical protein ADK67_31995 [Saccharothrix sp. NRRL B-16348]|uniref:hypothetical protein n=1 Tax=Saccharothrix sp. NRRL B-16348 TaxID=1415542 RepID=UPI0006AF6FF7|nr:hypothetical protein [Saccharothrix sp. NRRL B-16348]KOX19894.1 hypothetical protein ADK67_31995 [Saccharothrix sp. NRRL B-16348]